MQHYGLANVWQEGDFVTRAILIFLLAMSVASWAVMLIKGISLRRLKKMSRVAQKRFWAATSIAEGVDSLGTVTDNPYRVLALVAQEANVQQGGAQPLLQGSVGPGEWISRCVRNAFEEQVAQLQSGMAILASVGSTAPFVGLFGTVWGIYHALMVIGASGQASLDHVAGPVGESLIMTALGLSVAIPAVLGFNAIARSNKKVSRHLNRFAHELHVYFVTGSKVRSDDRAGRLAGSTKPVTEHTDVTARSTLVTSSH